MDVSCETRSSQHIPASSSGLQGVFFLNFNVFIFWTRLQPLLNSVQEMIPKSKNKQKWRIYEIRHRNIWSLFSWQNRSNLLFLSSIIKASSYQTWRKTWSFHGGVASGITIQKQTLLTDFKSQKYSKVHGSLSSGSVLLLAQAQILSGHMADPSTCIWGSVSNVSMPTC